LLLMPSIFPDAVSAGGIVYRDLAGAPTNPPNVTNAAPPPPAFLASCAFTALPNDCSARVESRQVNAIVSELTQFAACLDPNGPWDCNSLSNLCAAFTAWALINIAGVIVSDTPPIGAKDSQLWWESDTGCTYILYNDGNSTAWVQIAGPPVKVVMDNLSIVGLGTAASPHEVGLVDGGQW
jgi:hypothetical protein